MKLVISYTIDENSYDLGACVVAQTVYNEYGSEKAFKLPDVDVFKNMTAWEARKLVRQWYRQRETVNTAFVFFRNALPAEKDGLLESCIYAASEALQGA